MLINPNNFWKYAYSDFLDNRNRGALAEYMVAEALGVTDNTPFTSWESYDIEYQGLKIEVKTSAYVQSWKQDKPSKPSFGIPMKQGWVGETNEWDGEIIRHADVYVFCLLDHKDEKTINPLDTTQWVFYVVKTTEINEKLQDQKTVGLSTIEWLEHEKCSFTGIKFTLDDLMKI